MHPVFIYNFIYLFVFVHYLRFVFDFVLFVSFLFIHVYIHIVSGISSFFIIYANFLCYAAFSLHTKWVLLHRFAFLHFSAFCVAFMCEKVCMLVDICEYLSLLQLCMTLFVVRHLYLHAFLPSMSFTFIMGLAKVAQIHAYKCICLYIYSYCFAYLPLCYTISLYSLNIFSCHKFNCKVQFVLI